MNWKRPLALSLAALTLGGALTACGTPTASTPEETSAPAAEVQALAATSQALTAPKYVFMFIGDGMSYPQIQSTSDYLGALADEDYWQAQPSLDDNGGAVLDGPEYLNFMNFEGVGSAVTYDSNSFAPDSASTATSLSTGHKTYSGSINVDETGTVEYETISEKLHSQKGYSIGVITSVNLNHATPAAFYAHQASRNDYYDIGLELVDSGFEYFAGGGLLDPDGAEGDQENLYDLAEQAGYNVVTTQAEAEKVTAGPVVIIDEHLADSDAMAYELDRTDDMWALSDYVAKGIEVLSQDEDGFFMMCEGGKIDWACPSASPAPTTTPTWICWPTRRSPSPSMTATTWPSTRRTRPPSRTCWWTSRPCSASRPRVRRATSWCSPTTSWSSSAPPTRRASTAPPPASMSRRSTCSTAPTSP